MEPRTHARGNFLKAGQDVADILLQWSHALTRVETACYSPNRLPSPPLQWSHALTRVETGRLSSRVRARDYASMEPRTHARGNIFLDAGLPPGSSTLQWRHALTRVETGVWSLGGTAMVLLQWSHALTRVETRSHVRQRVRQIRASMEPRTHARGNGFRRRHPCVQDSGFNGATHSRAWKRIYDDTETSAMRVLQWSHALTRVETLGLGISPTRGHRASMEPRTHARGNNTMFAIVNAVSTSFNGATHSRAWKRLTQGLQGLNLGFASMEPRTHARGNLPRACGYGMAADRLQWSHALTRVETVSG